MTTGPQLTDQQARDALILRRFHRLQRTEGYHFFAPQDYQKPFFDCNASRIVIVGGNRSGKSQTVIKRLLDISSGQDDLCKLRGWEPPIYIRVCGAGMHEQVLKVLVEWFRKLTPRSWLPNGEFRFNSQTGLLRLADDGPCKGGFFEFMSYDQDAEKGSGRPLHVLALDEAYKCSQRFLNQCLARLIDYHGVAIAMETPEEGDATFTVKWYDRAAYRTVYDEETNTVRDVRDESRDQDYAAFCYPTRLNRYLYKDNDLSKASPAIGQIIKDCDDAPNPDIERRIRLNGEFVSIAGPIYPVLDYKTHVMTADKFGVDNSWTRYLAVDPGINKEHALIWAMVGPGKRIFFHRELYVTGTMDEMFFEARKAMGTERLKAVLFDCHWDWDNKTAKSKSGDPVNLKKELRQAMDESGFAHVDLLESKNMRVEAGLDIVRVKLRPQGRDMPPDMAFSPECRRLWSEMKGYKYAREKAKDPIRHNPKVRKIDDDGPDCVRITVTSAIEYGAFYDVPSVVREDVYDEYGIYW